MLEIKNTEVHGIERAFKVSGYPMRTDEPGDYSTIDMDKGMTRIMKLGTCIPGSGHDVSLTTIIVQYDVKYNSAWLKQFQRYHFHQINSSQSTMHMIDKMDIKSLCNEFVDDSIIKIVENLKTTYNNDKTTENFHRLVYNLPAGLEMWMGVTTNYLQLKTIYNQRKNHKLRDWKIFCDWCESLPFFKEFCIGK